MSPTNASHLGARCDQDRSSAARALARRPRAISSRLHVDRMDYRRQGLGARAGSIGPAVECGGCTHRLQRAHARDAESEPFAGHTVRASGGHQERSRRQSPSKLGRPRALRVRALPRDGAAKGCPQASGLYVDSLKHAAALPLFGPVEMAERDPGSVPDQLDALQHRLWASLTPRLGARNPGLDERHNDLPAPGQ
jgi:hypothetical protein